ncbi:MAG: hypothetical protein J6N21_06985 [Butyrivibrio sp.]|nr:hypothetical protein [Butyrivibrio sp.]MBP3196735.1 hypothetical protein [Butyrivibrio sp.]
MDLVDADESIINFQNDLLKITAEGSMIRSILYVPPIARLKTDVHPIR